MPPASFVTVDAPTLATTAGACFFRNVLRGLGQAPGPRRVRSNAPPSTQAPTARADSVCLSAPDHTGVGLAVRGERAGTDSARTEGAPGLGPCRVRGERYGKRSL